MPSNYKKICEENIIRRGTDFDDIGSFISEKLYSDRSHFVFELLQNAEDALDRRLTKYPDINRPCRVSFILHENCLEFRHYGILFDEDDVRSISDVLKGTKTGDMGQIGKFGIGFKSVYAFTSTPEIHSGDEHFIIRRYIRPEGVKPIKDINPGETVFIFPFDHEGIDPCDTFKLIYNKLKKLGPRVLLFLKRTEEIEWDIKPKKEKGNYIKEVRYNDNVQKVTVIGHNNHEEEDEEWLVFTKKIKQGSDLDIQIAYLLQKDTKSNRMYIHPVKESPLIAYFPTDNTTASFSGK